MDQTNTTPQQPTTPQPATQEPAAPAPQPPAAQPAATQPATEPAPATAAPPPTPDPATTQPAQPQTTTPASLATPAPHGKRNILVVAVLILLILLGVAAYLYFSRPTTTEQTSLPVTTATEEVAQVSPTPTPDDSQEAIEAIDTGDPETDLKDLNQEINQL